MRAPQDDPARVRDSASDLYANGQRIWDRSDAWNARKRREIDRFGRQRFAPLVRHGARVLNAGSGSERYDWMPNDAINLDRFEKQLKGLQFAIVADVEMLPFQGAAFDATVCVGSVLNYVSALEAIRELGRVTKPGGLVLLHFESSGSLEHIGTKRWRSAVASLPTINASRPDYIWIYSPRFIGSALAKAGLRIRSTHAFHIASALGLKLGLHQQQAARLAALDVAFAWASAIADDVMILCEKTQ